MLRYIFSLIFISFSIIMQAQNTPKEIKQTAGRDQLGEFAPKFAELNDDVLFGQVWNRQDKLSAHDRSVVTVVALMAQGLTDSSFRHHLEFAKANGVTREEIAEIITHAAFYAGWPKAWAAFRMAKDVWADAQTTQPVATTQPGLGINAMSKEDYQATIIFPIGEPNNAYAQYFEGQSYLYPVVTEGVKISNVTFEPGCRNHWHIHHASNGGGQTLICVGGRGYYQEWGKEPVEILPGDVVLFSSLFRAEFLMC